MSRGRPGLLACDGGSVVRWLEGGGEWRLFTPIYCMPRVCVGYEWVREFRAELGRLWG